MFAGKSSTESRLVPVFRQASSPRPGGAGAPDGRGGGKNVVRGSESMGPALLRIRRRQAPKFVETGGPEKI